MLRMLQRARITADDLKARLDRGERITILDLRGAADVACHPYMLPGALGMESGALRRLRELPRDAMVVVYGRRLKRMRGERATPHTNVVLGLYRVGFDRVRPLAGGLGAWRRRGYPVVAPSERAPERARQRPPRLSSSGKRASLSARTSSRREEPETCGSGSRNGSASARSSPSRPGCSGSWWSGDVGRAALLRSTVWALVVWAVCGVVWIGLQYGQWHEAENH